MKIKYVIFGDICPVLLSEANQHRDIRNAYGEATSAGFCSFQYNPDKTKTEFGYNIGGWEVSVWGESISLKLKSNPHDAHMIERLLGSDGF